MKSFLRPVLGLGVLAVTLATAPLRADTNAAGLVDFGKLTPPAKGGEFVEVNLQGNLLGMAAKLAAKEEPDVADLIKGLQLIHVNVVGLDDGNRTANTDRITALRSELDAKGWERIVSVKQEGQDVGIFLKTRGTEAVEGLVVTVIDGKHQAVLVNIVGDIRPEKLAALGERLDIDPLKQAGEALGKGKHEKK